MDLLLDIVHCPNAQACLSDPEKMHPCRDIVQSQGVKAAEHFQVPEPWSGHLETAPLLFLNSNPSISADEQYPRLRCGDQPIKDFFENRFGGGRKLWIKEGRYYLRTNEEHSRVRKGWVRYWAAVRQRAAELQGKDASELQPGIDYALSEVVHCKSAKERGVAAARDACAKLYLEPLIAASGARAIVCLGRHAAIAVGRTFPGVSEAPRIPSVHGPETAGGRKRYFAFLWNPGARGKPKSFADSLSQEELRYLRQLLAVAP